MSFNEYLKESIEEGMMSDLDVELRQEIKKLIPKYTLEDGLNVPGLALRIFDQYKSHGYDLDKLMDINTMFELINDVVEEEEGGEY